MLEDRDPLLGTIVAEHYSIEELIGEGGMGRVYRAHHLRLQRRHFAIKVLLGDLASTPEMRMRFAHEADAASRLDHPNVVPVVDFGRTESGLMFLAMELVDGYTLAEVIAAQAPMAPAHVIALARQLCAGLAHAHARGLVHRDFKPENVILATSGGLETPRILDFGLAIMADEEIPARFTTAGLTLGTPTYAAPEQTHDEPVDHRADLFALGVTMYEMLAGKLPFDGGALEVMHHNASGNPPPIATRSGARVPRALEQIVRRLMARLPEQRFASAADVIVALDHTSLVAAGRSRRLWAGVALAAVLGIAVIAIVGGTSEQAMPAVDVELAMHRLEPAAPTPAPQPPPLPPATPPTVSRVATRAKPPIRPQPPAVRLDPVAVTATLPPVVEPVAPAIEPTPVVVEPPRIATPAPPPAPIPEPPSLEARAAIVALHVRGSLSDAVVRRAIERTVPELRACYRRAARTPSRSATTTVHIAFVVDDTRRATQIRATAGSWSELASCVAGAIGSVRSQIAPDVGTVDVSLDLAFTPERS
ncbi:MAG: protein kinase [Kofleriaceae bacterium]